MSFENLTRESMALRSTELPTLRNLPLPICDTHVMGSPACCVCDSYNLLWEEVSGKAEKISNDSRGWEWEGDSSSDFLVRNL